MTRTDTSRATWRWIAIGLSLMVAVFLVAVAACGGSSESTPTPQGSSPAGQSPSAANPTETSSSGGNSSSSDIAAKLKDLSSKASQINGKVTYQMSTTDDKGVTTSGQMTLYSQPPKTRTDISSTDKGQTTNAILISTPDKEYTCTTEQSVGNVCIASPAASSNPLAGGLLGAFSDPGAIKNQLDNLPSGVSIETSSKTIAGVSGNCFSASGDLGSGQQGSGEFCFADNGLLLSVSFTSSKDSSKFSLVATQTGDVSDSDFNPPYPVTDLGNLPSGQ